MHSSEGDHGWSRPSEEPPSPGASRRGLWTPLQPTAGSPAPLVSHPRPGGLCVLTGGRTPGPQPPILRITQALPPNRTRPPAPRRGPGAGGWLCRQCDGARCGGLGAPRSSGGVKGTSEAWGWAGGGRRGLSGGLVCTAGVPCGCRGGEWAWSWGCGGAWLLSRKLRGDLGEIRSCVGRPAETTEPAHPGQGTGPWRSGLWGQAGDTAGGR